MISFGKLAIGSPMRLGQSNEESLSLNETGEHVGYASTKTYHHHRMPFLRYGFINEIGPKTEVTFYLVPRQRIHSAYRVS